ncbi:hypothetical protein XELAEV_18019509mg [Xenopus laevis]|uniref:Ig-like domain-containing protein n=1 Tax=Xenopus laevis TaxID=8355 RepID=A0A974DFW4_XENLA|nr:hypothetical protein XELAEV_18019509mg [Xenopus laevis]
MAAVLYVQGALLWLHLTQACELLQVSQEPQVMVTLAGKSVHIKCDIIYRNIARGTTISWAVEHVDPVGTTTNQIEQSEDIIDINGTRIIHHSVRPNGQSAMYYCSVTCGSYKTSSTGTYIHVRDYGYVTPTHPSTHLQSSLIALLVLLLLLSATGTALLLLPFIWKKRIDSTSMSHISSVPGDTKSTSPQKDKEASSSLYESLKPCPDSELYHTLETAPPLPKGKATHQSPKAKAAPQVKPTGAQELARGGSKKPPVKPVMTTVTPSFSPKMPQ